MSINQAIYGNKIGITNQSRNHAKAIIKAMGSKAKKLPNDIFKETYFLFVANAFVKMYIDGTSTKYDKVDKLCENLAKKSRLFSKNLNLSIESALSLFEDVEKEQLRIRNKPMRSRFEKRISFNEDNSIEVHGLLFAICMILEHEKIPNRSIHLPYAAAKELFKEFEDQKGVIYRNSKILPAKFKDYLYE
jgi:hypothetical protein